MKTVGQIYFKNKGLKRFYMILPIVAVAWIILFGLIAPEAKSAIYSFITVTIFYLVFMTQKYVITNENTIEFYHLFGRNKRLSMPIESISEILVKPYRLSIDYKTREDLYSRSTMLELSETDMRKMIDELTKRNPKITIS